MKRKLFAVSIVVVGVVLASSCGSYKDDLYKICHAQRLSGAAPDSGLAGSAEWLKANLSTRKSKELMQQLAVTGSIEVMRAEVAANGVAPCPLLDPR